MYKITFPKERKFTGTYLSVSFRDGQGETDSAYLAGRFQAKGLIVTESEKQKAEKSIEKMNTTELTAKAAEIGVDISGCKNNAERVAALLAAVKPPTNDPPNDDLPPEEE